MRRQIFISSVQKELRDIRDAVSDYVTFDPLLSQFFSPFQLENLPAADRRADDVYLEEVARTDIYLGLFANEYGWEDEHGLSPTDREYNAATESGFERLIFAVDSLRTRFSNRPHAPLKKTFPNKLCPVTR